jgi:hypothetical protein
VPIAAAATIALQRRLHHPSLVNHHTPPTPSAKKALRCISQLSIANYHHLFVLPFLGVVAVAQVPDYSGLEAQWQRPYELSSAGLPSPVSSCRH